MKKKGRPIYVFLMITALLSAINIYTIIKGLPITWFLMWSPGAAAIITAKLYRSDSMALGVKQFRAKETLLGVLIPILYLSLCYGLYWLLFKGFAPSENDFLDVPILILISLPINVLAALGEEIGWRGFLAPKLTEAMGFGKAAILSGVIWAVWHFPLIISGTYLGNDTLWLSLLIFTILVVVMGTMMMFLRLSGSVWPAVFFHASHNFVDQVLCGPSTSGNYSYFVGETGVLTTLFALICLIFVWIKNRKSSVSGSLGRIHE